MVGTMSLQAADNWDFPGGAVVRTQRFHCLAWVQSLVGKLRSGKPYDLAKNKNEKSRDDNQFLLGWGCLGTKISTLLQQIVRWCVALQRNPVHNNSTPVALKFHGGGMIRQKCLFV